MQLRYVLLALNIAILFDASDFSKHTQRLHLHQAWALDDYMQHLHITAANYENAFNKGSLNNYKRVNKWSVVLIIALQLFFKKKYRSKII